LQTHAAVLDERERAIAVDLGLVGVAAIGFEVAADLGEHGLELSRHGLGAAPRRQDRGVELRGIAGSHRLDRAAREHRLGARQSSFGPA
jgi:hypothetical protein